MLTNFDTVEVEMSKYLIMDDSFELALDCIRHELAHVIAGYDQAATNRIEQGLHFSFGGGVRTRPHRHG